MIAALKIILLCLQIVYLKIKIVKETNKSFVLEGVLIEG